MLKSRTKIIAAFVVLGAIALLAGCSSNAGVPPVSGTFAKNFSGDGIAFTTPSISDGRTGTTTLKQIADTEDIKTYEVSIEDLEGNAVNIGDESDDEGYVIASDLAFSDIQAIKLTGTQHAIVTCSTTSTSIEDESENENGWSIVVTIDGRDVEASIVDLPITDIVLECTDNGDIRKSLSIAGVNMAMTIEEAWNKLGSPLSEDYPELDGDSFSSETVVFPIAGGGTVDITYIDGLAERIGTTSNVSLLDGKDALQNNDLSIRESILKSPVKSWSDIAHSNKVDILLNGIPVITGTTTVGSMVQAIPGDWEKTSYNEEIDSGVFIYSLKDKGVSLMVLGDTQESTVMGVNASTTGSIPFVIAGMDTNVLEKDMAAMFGHPVSMEADNNGRKYTFDILTEEDDYMLDITFGIDGKISNIEIKSYGFMESDEMFDDELIAEEGEEEEFFDEESIEEELADTETE